MVKTPPKEKLLAVINNSKVINDKSLLENAFKAYEYWISQISSLTSKGNERVVEMTKLRDENKDYLEVDLTASKGSPFLKSQKASL